MPVQLQCVSVVIRNDALDRVLEGGSASFEEIAPNAMSYADDMLSQASFMSSIDAEEYAKSLELHGLSRDSDQPDFVLVNSRDQSIEPECDWLILFEFEQRLIATMQGNRSRTVIAPAIDEDYNPDNTRHYTAEEIAERFEFVERKDNIDTYRNKETGELVYHARTTESPDEIFGRAFETVWEHRREPGTPFLSSDIAEKLSEPIAELQSLVAKYPEVAKAPLALGMAWFAIGKVDAARRQLERASELDPENTIVLKELGGVCLELRDFAAAVSVATRAVAAEPDDADLLGNLAVSQLLDAKISAAMKTIEHALSLNASDEINRNIQGIIKEVASGRRAQPTSLEEMMRRPKPKPSLLARIFGSRAK